MCLCPINFLNLLYLLPFHSWEGACHSFLILLYLNPLFLNLHFILFKFVTLKRNVDLSEIGSVSFYFIQVISLEAVLLLSKLCFCCLNHTISIYMVTAYTMSCMNIMSCFFAEEGWATRLKLHLSWVYVLQQWESLA